MVENTQNGKVTCPVCYVGLNIAVDLRGTEGTSDEPDAPQLCAICCENPMDAVYLDCGHTYTCMECTGKLKTKSCPVCRAPIKKIIRAQPSAPATPGSKPASLKLGAKNLLQHVDLSQFASSTKVDALVRGIEAMLLENVSLAKAKGKNKQEPNKAIVFSQYVNMLDIVEYSLNKAGIKVVKLVGSMPMAQRRAMLQAFRTEAGVSVILMSLKAGGEGLNLQAASHVYILDPWWNPAVITHTPLSHTNTH
jgi:DNA repair protein RAD16